MKFFIAIFCFLANLRVKCKASEKGEVFEENSLEKFFGMFFTCLQTSKEFTRRCRLMIFYFETAEFYFLEYILAISLP